MAEIEGENEGEDEDNLPTSPKLNAMGICLGC